MPQIPFPRWACNQKEAISRYGFIEGGTWPDVAKWCSLLELPPFMVTVKNSLTGFPLSHLYCNRDMQGPLLAALGRVNDAGLIPKLRSFDGCYCVRSVRGSSELSAHAWALAIDFNGKENPLGQTPTMDPGIIKAFTSIGFVWGGSFPRKDGMHFSWAGW